MDAICFVLDDKLVEIDFQDDPHLKPTTTVLNFLRSLPGHRGVKEGCGEGDCGACTVVVGELTANGTLRYSAVNSCLLFLPMIHGKQLITIENLAVRNHGSTSLHPVQQAMVEHHGAQCGFCTPGMVMSLFSLYKDRQNANDCYIRESLAGNLCRCTGYLPILEAARKIINLSENDHFKINEERIVSLLKNIRSRQVTIRLLTPGQVYFKPFSMEEALQIRAEHHDAVVVSGSTDVSLRQTRKREMIAKILDISGIGNDQIHEDQGHWYLGAGTKLEAVKNWSRDLLPALHDILSLFGSRQIRNLATLGGNIGSASPIGDTLPLLLVLETVIRVRSIHGERTIPLTSFITGYRQTDLRPEELITEIIIPKPGEEEIIRAYKVSKRKDVDISTVSAAFRLKLAGGRVQRLLVAYGGMAAQPIRAEKVESSLTGGPWNQESVLAAMKIIGENFNPLSDTRAGAAYRQQVAMNLFMKFFTETGNS